MTDPMHQSTTDALSLHMDRMGMAGDLEAGLAAHPGAAPLEVVTASRPVPALFFSARALRCALARIQAQDLEGKPEAWTIALEEIEKARELAEPVVMGRVG